jgi:hypothetical protein
LPPVLSATFTPGIIFPDGGSTLRFSIANPNPVPLTGVAFGDILPEAREVPFEQLQVPASAVLENGCTGSWSASPDGGSLSLTGGSLDASGACAVSAEVSISDPSLIFSQATFVDFTQPIHSTEGGGGQYATATLIVVPCGDDSEYCCTGGVCNPGLACDSTLFDGGVVQLCKDPACSFGTWGTTCALPDGGSPTPCCGALSCISIGPALTPRFECCDGTDFTNTLCCPAGTHVDPASNQTVCN